MQISRLLLPLPFMLGSARASKGFSRSTRTRAAPRIQTHEANLATRGWEATAITYSVVPPIRDRFCDPLGVNHIANFHLTINPASSKISSKCNQIGDYMSEGFRKDETAHKVMLVLWVCPDEVHLTIPAPFDGHPTAAQFTVIADADFPAGHNRAMAMLNVTDPQHDPPIDISNVQVMLGYDLSDGGKPAVTYLYCM